MSSIAIVGRGRLGRALAAALAEAGVTVRGPLARGEHAKPSDLFLLCVPEPELQAASAAIAGRSLVGHCSASASLDLLAPHERFVAHPLMTVTKAGARFKGAACAIDGSSKRALSAARVLAQTLGMRPIHVPPDRRMLYHAAASMASNFLVTLEAAAERLGAECGVDRAGLAPLVRAAADNWATLGAAEALSGPIARGDDLTASRQRAAVAGAAPDLLPMWDALASATAALAARTRGN
ncbi:MAG TPA: DUF2520 domain-containing protein [Gemmatimonadaceae bacterium]|jgi:predicted short-subunit dehydrogenase-like oxidoreductase (DUF2520 family)